MSPRGSAITIKAAQAPAPGPPSIDCVPGHIHFWIVASPEGPTSMGCCKHCFQEREFLNSLVDFTVWEQTNDSGGFYE